MTENLPLNIILAKCDRDINKLHACYYLTAAHYYDMAILCSQTVKPSKINEAEQMADFVNLLFVDVPKAKPYDFMKSPEEISNEAIKNFEVYQNYIDLFPEEKHQIQSFCKWYANSNDADIIKHQILHILEIGTLSISIRHKELTLQQLRTYMASKRNQKYIIRFYPRLAAKGIIKAIAKIMEIKEKIEIRDNKKMYIN